MKYVGSGFVRAAACGASAMIAAVITVSCSDKSTEPEPQPVEKTLKIAFVSDRDGNPEIYVMNADGTNQTRLTYSSGRDDPFSWSPDGSKICFVSERYDTFGIYVMDADGKHPKLSTYLRDNEQTRPVWSPDGRRIAFSAYAENSYEIEVMNADGTNLTNLTHSTWNDFDPTWSPDGTQIAFVTEDSLPDGRPWSGVHIMNADGTGLYSPVYGTWRFRNTIWSPREDIIAYYQLSQGGPFWADICLFGPQTWQQLTFDPSHNYNHGWSPDGSKLAFLSDRDGLNEIYVMESDGSNQTRLTYSTGGTFGANWSAWTPDGSKLVFASDKTGNFEIYIMDFTVTQLTDNDDMDMFPSCAMSPYK
jgi:Tol biopolymer transport system component